ncbi:MAG TPA: hypothetical protein VIR30_02030 [Nocardioides sp.]
MRNMLYSGLARSIGFIPQGIAMLAISYLVIHHYGIEAFTGYALIASVMLLIPLNSLGVGASLTQSIAASGVGDEHAVRTGLTASRVLTVSTLFLAIVSTALGVAGVWPELLGDAAGANAFTAVALVIYAMSFVPGLGPSVLLGADRNHVAILGQSLQAPIALALVGVLILGDFSADWVIVVPALAAFLVNLVTMGLSARLTGFPWARVIARIPSRARFPGARIRSLSGPMLVTSLCLPIAFLCDRIILSHVSTTAAVADYTVVTQIFAPVTGLIVAGAQPLWPMYTRARARGEAGPNLKAVLAIFMLGTVLVCAVLVLVADRIGTFIGGDEINLGYFLPFVTAVVMCIQAVTYPLAMSLMDPAGARFVAICAVITVPCNITLSILLSERMGAPGPLVSLIIVSTVVQVIPVSIFARRRSRSGEEIALS